MLLTLRLSLRVLLAVGGCCALSGLRGLLPPQTSGLSWLGVVMICSWCAWEETVGRANKNKESDPVLSRHGRATPSNDDHRSMHIKQIEPAVPTWDPSITKRPSLTVVAAEDAWHGLPSRRRVQLPSLVGVAAGQSH